MKTAVLCYLITHTQHLGGRNLICLAKKKKKIGAGLWNGYGGHCKSGEKASNAVARELQEEGRVTLEECALVATITYWERPLSVQYRELQNYDASMQVHTFLGHTFLGKEPEETEEMGAPMWFLPEQIPYQKMLPADQFILPMIIAHGLTPPLAFAFEADVYYGPGKKEVDWIAIRPFS